MTTRTLCKSSLTSVLILLISAGRLAFSRGHYVATFSPKDGGQPIPVDGKFMTILKMQSDGGWKIHRDIFNSNVPSGGQ